MILDPRINYWDAVKGVMTLRTEIISFFRIDDRNCGFILRFIQLLYLSRKRISRASAKVLIAWCTLNYSLVMKINDNTLVAPTFGT